MASSNQSLPTEVILASRTTVNGATSSMRYPSEHGRYFTMITFVKYQRKNPKRAAIKLSQANIILPLPANLSEYYAIQYGDESFNQTGGAVDTVDRLVSSYLNAGGTSQQFINDTTSTAGAAGVEWSQALARGTSNYFSPELSGVIDRIQGNIVNPHITSLFKGVGLREHQLSWRLHAKNAAESAEIKKIRDFIRDRMHPEKKSDFLLNFPDEVYVKFYANNKEFLYPIFKAVVTSVSSTMSSDGTNAFFKGTDEPVIIDLNLSIKEVEAVTREDFTNKALTGSAIPPEVKRNDSGSVVTGGAR